MTTNQPPKTDFWGFWKITKDNFKEFEPKQPTDEIWVDNYWRRGIFDTFAEDAIYRRRIPIPDGWELVKLESVESVNRCRVRITHGWTDILSSCSITDFLHNFPDCKAIIRQNKPQVMDEICECGHEYNAHICKGFAGCCPCGCKNFFPKQKGGDEMQTIPNLLTGIQPSPEITQAGIRAHSLSDSIRLFCSVCKLVIDRKYNLIKPCQTCLDAAKGEWVLTEKELPPDIFGLTMIQYNDGTVNNVEACYIRKYPEKYIRWFKSAPVPKPPSIVKANENERDLESFILSEISVLKCSNAEKISYCAGIREGVLYARKEKK